MMRAFLTVLLICLLSLPAAAQLYDAEGEKIPGEGPKGRYTREQLLPIVLNFMPGEVIKDYSNYQDVLMYHAFTIARPDGSIYQLKYWALSAELFEIRVDELGEKPVYPPGMFDQDEAKEIAREHIQDKTNSGNMKAKVKGLKIDVNENRRLVYRVKVRKMVTDFLVTIDAFSGQIIDTKEQ